MLPTEKERPKRNKQGFTLVEVLIAIVIFALVIASGFACVKMGLTFVDNSRHNTRAAQIMQSEIERVRSMAWDTLNALPTAATEINVDAIIASEASYADYTLTRTITTASATTRKITLVCAWTDIGGKAYSKTYVTLYAKGGLYDYIQ